MRYEVSPEGVVETATKATPAKTPKAKANTTSHSSQKFPRNIFASPLARKCYRHLRPLAGVVPRKFIPSVLRHPPETLDLLNTESADGVASGPDHTATLPDELLLEVFRHVEPSELASSVQHVNARWGRVAQDVSLWRDYEYAPARGTPTREVTAVLRQSPHLRAFSLPPGADANAALDVLSNRCRRLQSLNVEVASRLNVRVAKSLFTRLPALRQLQLSQRPRVQDGVYKRLALGFRPLSVEHSDMSYFYESLSSSAYRSQTYMFMAKFVLRARRNDIDHLCFNFVSDEMLELVEQCPGLENLRLEFNQYQEGLKSNLKFIRGLRNLQSLDLVNFQNDEVINEMFSDGSWPELKELDLSWCSELSDRTCRTIQESCPNLEKIVLDFCLKVTDKGIQHLSKLAQLKHVKMSSCTLLTTESVRLMMCRQQVEDLDLADFVEPMDDAIPHLVLHKQLRFLSLRGCIIAPENIKELRLQLKHTKILIDPMKTEFDQGSQQENNM